jgi:hypothetical protein
MEITKAYLDKQFKLQFTMLRDFISNEVSKLVTKDELRIELNNLRVEIDSKLAIQSEELKQYTNDAFETHRVWVRENFKDWIKPYDLRRKVARLQTVYRRDRSN